MTTDHEHFFEVQDGNHAGTLRAWRPGDGLTCAYAERASRARPCGRPVAVRETSWLGRGNNPKTAVVCMYHVDRLTIAPGKARADAEKVAREKVIADHWDEYQQVIRDETETRIQAALEDLPRRTPRPHRPRPTRPRRRTRPGRHLVTTALLIEAGHWCDLALDRLSRIGHRRSST